MKKFYLLMMFALLGMVANAQTFQKVTDVAQLADGDKVVFVNEEAQKIMAEQKTNNRGAVDVQISGEQIVEIPEGATVFTVGKGVTNVDCFTFFDSVKNGYLYAASSSSNYLKTQSTIDGNSEWRIEISTETTITAQGDKTRNNMRYNPNNGSPIFACYSSGQKAITIYKEAGEVVEPTQVAAPTFSVAEGSYVDAQSIELSCATAGASIFYTINNGVESIYEAPIELSENGEYVIKAWAKKEGLEDSEVVTKTYTINIFDGLIEDFDFVTIGQTNGYPTGVDGAVGATPTFTSGIVTVSTQEGGTPNRFWSNWKEYRMYNGATLTFSVPTSYTIVKIELTPTNSPVQGEGYTKGVWNGEQSSVSLNITGSAKFTDFVVYYKQVAADQVLAPTFSLTSGTYEGTQSLTLNCETEGATIYYTVNGGETQTYANDAIELTEGKYAFVAWAEKDGMTKSSEVTANYTIVAPLVANSIAEFLTLGAEYADREITLNCDLTVTYQGGGNDNNRDLYVKDAAGQGLLIFSYENPLLNNGNVIPAGLKGKLKDYNGLPELIEPVYFGEVTSGEEVAPEVFTAATITANDLSKYIVLNEVTLTALDKNKNGTLTDVSGDVVIRDNGYYEYPTDFSKKYDVTAVVAIFKGTIQVYPTEIVEHTSSSVNDAVANEFKAVAVVNGIEVNVAEAGLVSVYNAAGQLVANVNVAEGATTINVAGGFYIVKAGNNVAKVLVK